MYDIVDDAGEDITLTQSAQEYFDEGADQTLCMKIKTTAAVDNNVKLAWIRDSESNDFDITENKGIKDVLIIKLNK